MPADLSANPRGVLRFASAILIAAAVGIVFLQWIPQHLRSFQVFDSGIFLYVGDQLRHGQHLYSAVWDHKPPLIFVWNAAGLTLGGGSPAGVFWLLLAASVVFFLVAFRELSRLFGSACALTATLFGVLFFHDIAPQPNLGEVLSLPFQVAAFLLLARDYEDDVSLLRAASQGVLFALLFWTRPNGIAIGIVYCVATLVRLARDGRYAFAGRWVLLFASGLIAATAVIAVPFAALSSWRDLWFATVSFNQLYAGLATATDRARALWWMLQVASVHGVALLALAGSLALVLLRTKFPRVQFRLLAWCVIWLLLEFTFAAYTGKLYGKNLIAATLPMMITVATLLSSLPDISCRACSAVLLPFVVALSVGQYRENAKAGPSPDAPLLQQIDHLSAPSDLVTFWGVFSPETIFHSRRRSATRFFSSVPLSHGEAAYRLLAPDALADLQRHEPVLLVERSEEQFPPLGLETNSSSNWDTDALRKQKAALMASYHIVWRDAPTHTEIYQRTISK